MQHWNRQKGKGASSLETPDAHRGLGADSLEQEAGGITAFAADYDRGVDAIDVERLVRYIHALGDEEGEYIDNELGMLQAKDLFEEESDEDEGIYRDAASSVWSASSNDSPFQPARRPVRVDPTDIPSHKTLDWITNILR